jgi:leucyl/phenylalanyl-tRNA--protein transferase
MITWLSPDDPPERFPPHEAALRDPPGLLAAGGDLKYERLLAAYERGIFPWYSPGQPVLWWSPDPREVLLPQEFHYSRRFSRSLRTRGFEWLADRDFAAVVAACAAPRARSPGTWITAEMSAAYCGLHQRGLAHSYEIWHADRVGRVFFGESMLSRERDASKAALAGLVQRCGALGIELIDCQLPSAHLRSLGSRAMPRRQFLRFLRPA